MAAVRLDQRAVSLEELRARRTMNEAARGGRRRRRRRPPRQVFPRGQEVQLRILLEGVVDAVRDEVESSIVPLVDRLAPLVRDLRPDASGLEARRDAPADEIEDEAEEVRSRLAGTVLAAGTLAVAITTIGTAVSRHNRTQLDRIFDVTLGVGLPVLEPDLDDLLRGFARENIRLAQRLGNDAVDRVSGSVIRGFRRGQSNAQIGEAIRADLGVSRRRAHLIARDQVASLNGELTQIRQTRMGVEEYVWRTAGDERVRPSHEALDGTRQRWDDPPAEGHPGEPINCRCVAEPVLASILEGL